MTAYVESLFPITGKLAAQYEATEMIREGKINIYVYYDYL